ncbi:FxSxx-COOH system tetratricopeptide repeat protein [Actinomadura fibrosa]|uniref:FxSxx-COOH system tetratricopeptide repeat protein n=1 Tax=Actinomadura fibrosa TaxID=111802 RepID=A0ABW2XJ53_9ACTN|nr:FxSxx-COOH system tetratricopeptide repeat protein [Actinomadura fibrosa]
MTDVTGEGVVSVPTRARRPIWCREIPFRNPHFTGRERALATLYERLTSASGGKASGEVTTALLSQPTTPLYGLGGVGKTEIAAEYCHRYSSEYDLVWWIGAEQEDTIRDGLVALGHQMGLPDFRAQERDYSAQVVLDALRAGQPYDRWLLVFDNATQPEVVSKYVPQGTGHVILTSRVTEWRRSLRTDGIEVAEFDLPETVDFLRKRVELLRPSDDQVEEKARLEQAERLAQALDNLPLAAEHAAAFLVETGTPIEEYLAQYARNAHELFGQDVDIYYPHAVATTWSVSRGTISREADSLFQLLAFFSPEPVSEELLVQPNRAPSLPGPLSMVVGDLQEYRRAARELARFSLVKIFGVRNVVQMHRVVQAVTRGRLEREDAEAAAEFRAAVHTLLAASDPGSPDLEENDPIYERSRHHLMPSGALQSPDRLVRALIINQVRRMHLRGGYSESLSLGEAALGSWRTLFGQDDLQTLSVSVEVAWALLRSNRLEEARQLIVDTLERVRSSHGESHDVYLRGARVHGTCLRTLGRFNEAYEHDAQMLPVYERELRGEHLETWTLRNNIALDLRCLGRYSEALEMDELTLTGRERLLGPIHADTLTSRWAVARDLRQLGRYEESLDLLRRINQTQEDKNEPYHYGRLLVLADQSVALRRMGYHKEAHHEGLEALQQHRSTLGPEHRQTLLVATNLVNDYRLTDDLGAAQKLGEETLALWEKQSGADHPNTLATMANLAVVLRMRDNPAAAEELNVRALAGMRHAHGNEEHPHVLIISANLASDLAALGEVQRARELGEKTLDAITRMLGAEHPWTLAIAANLALDRRASGDESSAHGLYETSYAISRRTLTVEHPLTRIMSQRGRINMDLEPMAP